MFVTGGGSLQPTHRVSPHISKRALSLLVNMAKTPCVGDYSLKGSFIP